MDLNNPSDFHITLQWTVITRGILVLRHLVASMSYFIYNSMPKCQVLQLMKELVQVQSTEVLLNYTNKLPNIAYQELYKRTCILCLFYGLYLFRMAENST